MLRREVMETIASYRLIAVSLRGQGLSRWPFKFLQLSSYGQAASSIDTGLRFYLLA